MIERAAYQAHPGQSVETAAHAAASALLNREGASPADVFAVTKDLERAEALLNVLFEANGLNNEQFQALAEMARALTTSTAFAVMEPGAVFPRQKFLIENLCRADNLLSVIASAKEVDVEPLRQLTEMAWALVQECYFILIGRASDDKDLPAYFVRSKEALS
ncbi:hypothetical protein [Lysobacter panacisoli]|uniref:Uncharacterized protein n=1 Tax=Lysobacter panacisoli TaxID=1255263 RepID=A0ABP9LGH1_9GAMM|nr:hypothetical protein [Lysobacter panacisoli]